MIDKPLYQNPLGGGQLGGLGEISGIAFNPPKQEAPPLAEVYTNPVTKQLLDDFSKSDFAKNVNHMQQDHMEIDLNGLPISGNGSFIGNLMQYLKSVGKDNMVSQKNLQKFEPLAQVPGQELLGNSDPYTVNYGGMDIGPNVGNEIAVPDNQFNATDPGPLGSPIGLDGKPVRRAVTPIVTGPQEIATQDATNPYQEQFTGFQNQLTGFGDQFSGLNDRLNKIEEGIASLLGNRGQGFNMGFQPNYGFNYSGIGSFFPPFGGMYG